MSGGGFFQQAMQAMNHDIRQLNKQMVILDTKLAAMRLMMVELAKAEAARQGKSVEDFYKGAVDAASARVAQAAAAAAETPNVDDARIESKQP